MSKNYSQPPEGNLREPIAEFVDDVKVTNLTDHYVTSLV
jgi:hypothetical protein